MVIIGLALQFFLPILRKKSLQFITQRQFFCIFAAMNIEPIAYFHSPLTNLPHSAYVAKSYAISNPREYQYFRYEVSEVNGASELILGGFEFIYDD